MSLLKRNGTTRRALLGMAIFVVASTAVLADTTTLICDINDPAGVYKHDGPATIELNETQGSVVVNFPGVTNFNSIGYVGGRSVGPLINEGTSSSI